ncbi:unnamed protein product, partial [marine sediment metagenome]
IAVSGTVDGVDVAAHDTATTGVHDVGANHIAEAPTASHLVRTFTKGWTSNKFLKGAGVNANPTEVDIGFVFAPQATSLYMGPPDTLCSSPFTALINGNPTATSVVYDNDLLENSLPAGPQCGRLVLYNTTRGNSRLIVTSVRGTNTITTVASTDDWADGDSLTTLSSIIGVVAEMMDLDVITGTTIPAAAIGIKVFVNIRETGALDAFNDIV